MAQSAKKFDINCLCRAASAAIHPRARGTTPEGIRDTAEAETMQQDVGLGKDRDPPLSPMPFRRANTLQWRPANSPDNTQRYDLGQKLAALKDPIKNAHCSVDHVAPQWTYVLRRITHA